MRHEQLVIVEKDSAIAHEVTPAAVPILAVLTLQPILAPPHPQQVRVQHRKGTALRLVLVVVAAAAVVVVVVVEVAVVAVVVVDLRIAPVLRPAVLD